MKIEYDITPTIVQSIFSENPQDSKKKIVMDLPEIPSDADTGIGSDTIRSYKNMIKSCVRRFAKRRWLRLVYRRDDGKRCTPLLIAELETEAYFAVWIALSRQTELTKEFPNTFKITDKLIFRHLGRFYWRIKRDRGPKRGQAFTDGGVEEICAKNRNCDEFYLSIFGEKYLKMSDSERQKLREKKFKELREIATPLERKVLDLWLQGMSTDEIAIAIGRRHRRSVHNAIRRLRKKYKKIKKAAREKPTKTNVAGNHVVASKS